MADPTRQTIPTHEQLQALAAGFGRIGQLAQRMAVAMIEDFDRKQRRTDPTYPTYFGRKRRARRARGRRIEARRPLKISGGR